MQERRRLGETLRAARLAKGVSLDEAAAATRIGRPALRALESEEFDELPAPVYTRGLLVNYARYLGLDPNAVLEEYERQQGTQVEPAEPPPAEESPRDSPLPILKYLFWLGLALTLGVISVFVWREFLSAGPADPVAEVEPTVAPTAVRTPRVELPPLPTATPVPTPSPVPSPTPTVTTTGVTVALSATTQRVWIQVSADGSIVFLGTIGPETEQGTNTLTWNAADSIEILFGRTGGVEIALNGRDLEPLVVSQNPVTFQAARTETGEIETTVSINGTPVPAEE